MHPCGAEGSIFFPLVVAHFKIDETTSTILSKQGCKDQDSIQSSITPDPGYQWDSDKFTVGHHKREPIGQPFPSR